MIKSFLLNFLFVFFLIFVFTHAAGAAPLQRFSGNPVLNSTELYDKAAIFSSSTILVNNKFYMYYGGGDGQKDTINLAESNNGINWVKNNNNPLISPNNNNPYICEKGVHDPDVIYDQQYSKFKMWFVANCEPQQTGIPRYWIKYAESTNGIDWNVRDEPVLSPSFLWEIEGLSWPTVLKKDNKYQIWYSGRNSQGLWQIGTALSNDGINWQKTQNPVISPTQSWETNGIGGPDVIYENNEYILYYHSNIIYAKSNDGINWIKPTDNPLLTRLTNENIIWSPDVVLVPNNKYIYYSVQINGVWHISLASEKNITQRSQPKLILIPGFFGSWNKEALLHNNQTNPSDWKLNPIVTEYDGIINSLKNIGLVENSDFYVFAYDWRKPLNDSAIVLNNFITNVIPDPDTKIKLLGHSEGGQVARVYAQKFGTDKIDKIVTVGSPYKGSAISYKGVEGGELDASSPLDFVGKKIMLQLNKKNKLETDRVTLNNSLPILKDLLPTYDYLTDSIDNPISINSMSIKNDTLLSYQPTLPDIFSKLSTFYGEKGNTLLGHKVGPRTIVDQLYDLYPDGHPVQNLYEIGDETIVASSANAGTDSNVLVEKNHGQIVTDILPIKQMFTKLGLSYQDGQIVAGKSTALFPGLLFLIQSPATMHVTNGGNTYDEKDGMIFIPNPPSGNYQLNVNGLSNGDYTVSVAQLINNDAIWNDINGTITNSTNQTDSYSLSIDNTKLQPFIINQNDPVALFDLVTNDLVIINNNQPLRPLTEAINSLETAKNYYIVGNGIKLDAELNTVHRLIFQSFKKINDTGVSELLGALGKFENLYDVTLNKIAPLSSISRLDEKLSHYQSEIDRKSGQLLSQKAVGKNIVLTRLFVSASQNKLNIARQTLQSNNNRYIDILIQSISRLLIL